MSEPASIQPEQTPFEKFQGAVRHALSIPKIEIDRRDEVWRQEQEQAKEKKGIDKSPSESNL